MPSPYQSPTRQLSAEARLDNGSRVAGTMYLHPHTLAPGGYESPLDLMNGHELFFPVSVDGAGVVLLGKERTVSVAFPRGDETEYVITFAPERPVILEVLLSDGRTLKGSVLVDLPSAYSRPLDLMNGADDFVPIRDDTHVHLVNRGHIRTVHPLD